MKFRLQTEHAIELLGKLLGRSKTVTLAELIQGTSIGVKYAEVVMLKLRRAGLAKSVLGRHGGY